jgi:multisubunit Na+/H+ antiporter MnhB subunit
MNETVAMAFDALLGGLLLWLAWRALAAPDMFEGIVLFIAFGLCLALAWVRLRAPDIALAEAAVGSGITGALLLAAWNRMASPPGTPPESLAPPAQWGTHVEAAVTRGRRWPLGAACVGVAVVLGWAVLWLPVDSPGLRAPALAQLPRSGVSNPVTAALLNYRGYDTLLEVTVLLVAVVAAWAMAPADEPAAGVPRGPVLHGLARVLTPVLILLTGYLVWIGSSRPGGAFQGGALLAGGAVLLLLACGPRRRLPAEWLVRAGLVVGLATFLGVAAGVMGQRRRLLEYPEGSAGALILLIECAAVVSIALTLAALFLGGRPAAEVAEDASEQEPCP